MTTNIEIAATQVPALPLSLVSTAPRKPVRSARCTARAASQAGVYAEVRMDLVNSLRQQIANRTYCVSAMQIADCMMNSIYA